jgi:hypothetical protein
MNPFSSFSDEIRKRIMQAFDQKEVIAAAVKKAIGMEISKDLMNLKDTVLTVRVSGAIKQELMIKSKEIQRMLESAGIKITEIR